MKATQPRDATTDFVSVDIRLPQNGTEVMVRGWGEKRGRYIYDFARFEIKTACKRWVGRDNNTLSFEPIEWASLPQP